MERKYNGKQLIYEIAPPMCAKELPVVCILPPQAYKNSQHTSCQKEYTEVQYGFHSHEKRGEEGAKHKSSSPREEPIISLSANDDIWFY